MMDADPVPVVGAGVLAEAATAVKFHRVMSTCALAEAATNPSKPAPMKILKVRFISNFLIWSTKVPYPKAQEWLVIVMGLLWY